MTAACSKPDSRLCSELVKATAEKLIAAVTCIYRGNIHRPSLYTKQTSKKARIIVYIGLVYTGPSYTGQVIHTTFKC